uniref:Uncharacterized protein n=1 Tax=Vitis vinifera TaxID=29760 RepID=F6I3R1_VITVI
MRRRWRWWWGRFVVVWMRRRWGWWRWRLVVVWR